MSADARARNLEHARKRRGLEHADVMHFLVFGHDAHVERGCIFEEEGGERCSRAYDPRPCRGAEPTPASMYAGTGIGALYGDPGGERFAWELAGWDVAIGDGLRDPELASDEWTLPYDEWSYA